MEYVKVPSSHFYCLRMRHGNSCVYKSLPALLPSLNYYSNNDMLSGLSQIFSSTPSSASHRSSLPLEQSPKIKVKKSRPTSAPPGLLSLKHFIPKTSDVPSPSQPLDEEVQIKSRPKSTPIGLVMNPSMWSQSIKRPKHPRRRTAPIFGSPAHDYDLHGHDQLVQIVYGYLRRAYGCTDETSMSRQHGQPPLPQFIADLIHESGAKYYTIAHAIVILHRSRQVLPNSFEGYMLSGHLLFFSALLVVMDHYRHVIPADNLTIEFWSRASGYSVEKSLVYREQMWVKVGGRVRCRALWIEPVLKTVGWPKDQKEFGWPPPEPRVRPKSMPQASDAASGSNSRPRSRGARISLHLPF